MKELKLHLKKIKCYPTKSKSGNTKRKNTVLMQRGLELNPKVTYLYCLVYLTISLISKDIQLSFFFYLNKECPYVLWFERFRGCSSAFVIVISLSIYLFFILYAVQSFHFLNSLSTSGLVGAYPSFHGTKGMLHPGQITRFLTGLMQIHRQPFTPRAVYDEFMCMFLYWAPGENPCSHM